MEQPKVGPAGASESKNTEEELIMGNLKTFFLLTLTRSNGL